jgi:hypothetical protein
MCEIRKSSLLYNLKFILIDDRKFDFKVFIKYTHIFI